MNTLQTYTRQFNTILTSICAIALVAFVPKAYAGGGDDEKGKSMNDNKAVATISPASGSDISGEVWFTQTDKGVRMVADLEGVRPSGAHAIHIHETGDCSAKDASSAGGHWNPTSTKHGDWGHKPHHRGDIGNLISDEQGEASYDHHAKQWCVGCDNSKKNVVGKAVVIHIGEDDEKSQPSGAAGPRIGCGVIQMQVK